MKTFEVAEWEGNKTGDNILQKMKELGTKETKLRKNKRFKKLKLKKIFQQEKSAMMNQVEGNSGLHLKKKKRRNKKNSVNNKNTLESETNDNQPNIHVRNKLNTHMNSNKRKNTEEPKKLNKKQKLQQKLKATLEEKPEQTTPQSKKPKLTTLREKMVEKLKSAKFRFLNEQIYTTTGREMHDYFKTNVDDFQAYHEGYKQQVTKWPMNPLDVIIKKINKLPPTHVIADFGCGEAGLAKSVKQKVHSFDLVAANELVTACDMARVPLANSSVDVAVFCLSLMGTNLHDFLTEANRVLKIGGFLKVAEVESRFESVEKFIKGVEKLGFTKTWKDLSHSLFYFMDFKKTENVKKKKNAVSDITLKPCLYKKR